MKWLSVTHNSPKWNPQWLWHSCIWASPRIFTYILIHWLWKSFSLDFLSLPAFFSLTTNKNTLDFITRDTYVESILSGTVLILPLSTSQEKKELFSTHIFPPLTSSPPFLFLPPFFSLSLHSFPLTPPPTLPPLPLELMFPLKMNFLLSQLIFSDTNKIALILCLLCARQFTKHNAYIGSLVFVGLSNLRKYALLLHLSEKENQGMERLYNLATITW